MKHKALSFHAPWAWLIRTGRKRIELRSKPTSHRGPLLVCAGLKASTYTALVDEVELDVALNAPRGVALCIVDVVDCRPATADDAHDACVQPPDGAWAWVLANPRPVARVPVSGKQGFFWVEPARPLVEVDENFEAWRSQYVSG